MCALDDDMPPFRTVFPFNQPPTLVRFDMACRSQLLVNVQVDEGGGLMFDVGVDIKVKQEFRT